MTKQEFLKNVNGMIPEDKHIHDIADSDYSVIERVYSFHPSISETDGKVEIAELYARFGWAVIMDMKPRADLMFRKEREIAVAKSQIESIESEIKSIRNGDRVF